MCVLLCNLFKGFVFFIKVVVFCINYGNKDNGSGFSKCFFFLLKYFV